MLPNFIGTALSALNPRPGQDPKTAESIIDGQPVRAVVSIAPFSPRPTLEFEAIPIGSIAVQRLLIQNPTGSDRYLYIKSHLPPSLDVAFDWHECALAKHTNMLLTITWIPTDEVQTKSLIIIYDGGMMHRNIVIHFSSVWEEEVYNPDADSPEEDTKETTVDNELSKLNEMLKARPQLSCTAVSHTDVSAVK
ncbi:protein abnormal spindle [Dendroctonus ponderosae]|uniref:Abnormal spindle-like microcephaly-associated protein ASH domain-containing protein n=1 Tax=Dendroctonus ponderosae TaxID=77166 RepID=A0AAR5Q9Z2_DENPD|nr:protein abnormal spindle [Dendroctonus ponderosae]